MCLLLYPGQSVFLFPLLPVLIFPFYLYWLQDGGIAHSFSVFLTSAHSTFRQRSALHKNFFLNHPLYKSTHKHATMKVLHILQIHWDSTDKIFSFYIVLACYNLFQAVASNLLLTFSAILSHILRAFYRSVNTQRYIAHYPNKLPAVLSLPHQLLSLILLLNVP